MRSVGDPNFIYSPWSDGRRRAYARRAKHRFMRGRSDLIGPLLPPDREPYRDSRYKKMGAIANQIETPAEPTGEIPAGSRVHLTEAFYGANQWHWRVPWGVLERYRWAKSGDRIVADVRWLGTYTCLSTYEPTDLEALGLR